MIRRPWRERSGALASAILGLLLLAGAAEEASAWRWVVLVGGVAALVAAALEWRSLPRPA